MAQEHGRIATLAPGTDPIFRGQIVAVGIVGFGMNTKEYGGSFENGIAFPTVMLVFFFPDNRRRRCQEVLGAGPTLAELSLQPILADESDLFE